MTDKKVMDPEEEKFSKDQIVKAKKYMNYRDFLTGNLDDKEYTFSEVDEFLGKFFEKVR